MLNKRCRSRWRERSSETLLTTRCFYCPFHHFHVFPANSIVHIFKLWFNPQCLFDRNELHNPGNASLCPVSRRLLEALLQMLMFLADTVVFLFNFCIDHPITAGIAVGMIISFYILRALSRPLCCVYRCFMRICCRKRFAEWRKREALKAEKDKEKDMIANPEKVSNPTNKEATTKEEDVKEAAMKSSDESLKDMETYVEQVEANLLRLKEEIASLKTRLNGSNPLATSKKQ